MYLKKCCCYFDLEIGFFTWSVITLIAKIYPATVFLLLPHEIVADVLRVYGILVFSWLIATVGMQFLALVGIVQKRSIFLQPYFVVLLLEPFVLLIFIILWCFLSHMIFLLIEIVVILIDVYSAMCLRSLYMKYLEREENHQRTNLEII